MLNSEANVQLERGLLTSQQVVRRALASWLHESRICIVCIVDSSHSRGNVQMYRRAEGLAALQLQNSSAIALQPALERQKQLQLLLCSTVPITSVILEYDCLHIHMI
jgi:hypothetical protein